MFFPFKEWNDDPNFVYLGSARNPHTKQPYDFYVHIYPEAKTIEFKYSYVCRHGLGGPDYGSSPICTAYIDNSHFGTDHMKDWVWGMEMAKKLTLYYLVTNKKPLLKNEGFDVENHR